MFGRPRVLLLGEEPQPPCQRQAYWFCFKHQSETGIPAVSALKITHRAFPGGPVARTLRSQCRGPGSLPGWGPGSHTLELKPGAAK